jgi:hypothetical protein
MQLPAASSVPGLPLASVQVPPPVEVLAAVEVLDEDFTCL